MAHPFFTHKAVTGSMVFPGIEKDHAGKGLRKPMACCAPPIVP
jgi:hypothetical protein